MTADVAREVRLAARVLLVDAGDRVLLFEGFDPAAPGESFWFTPGGAMEAGETLEQAALRELEEETGCTSAVLGPPVWIRAVDFSFDGVPYAARETFFLARVRSHDVDTAGFVEIERRTITRHRWWPLAELAATDDVVYPRQLAELLPVLLRDGAPATPVVLQG